MRPCTSRSRTPLGHHLIAQVLAEALVVGAIELKALTQLLQGQLVLRGDVGHHPIELSLVDAGAGLAGVGDKNAVLDQRLQGLLAQAGGLRHDFALLARLLPQLLGALDDLAGGDDVLVDDGSDVVPGLQRGRLGRHLECCQGQRHGEEGGSEAMHHGRKSELGERSELSLR